MKIDEMMDQYAASVNAAYGKATQQQTKQDKEEPINEAAFSVTLDQIANKPEADASKLIEQANKILEKTYEVLLSKLKRNLKLTETENKHFQKFMELCRKIVRK